jgi:surface polysaccharide O-acyltransferase-like enzyme
MGVGHLWFVACLLLYTLIYLLLEKLIPVLKSTSTFSFKSYFPIVYIIGLATIEYFVRLKYPIDKWETWLVPMEIAHLPQYFSLFILGTIFNSKNWLDKITIRVGVTYFSLALISFVIYKSGHLPVGGLFIETLIESTLCVGVGLGMLVLFRAFANNMNGFIKHLSDNSYGIYIFHLFIVIILQNLIYDWPLNGTLKFLVATVFGILLSVLLSSILRKSKTVRAVL